MGEAQKGAGSRPNPAASGVNGLAVRPYQVVARGLGALPPGLGEFRYANWVYRHRMQRLPRGSTVCAELMGGARFQLDVSEWPQALAFLLGL